VDEEQNSQHAISLFRFRMRQVTPAQNDEYRRTAEHLMKIASAMPGFISFRDYASSNGELLVMVEFASAEQLGAWRNHPEHREAQQLGRNKYYAEYEVVNCSVMHKYGYKRP
jgi:heme-degrading monooxygenase HmoA